MEHCHYAPSSIGFFNGNSIKILKKTIVSNEVAKVGSVHTLPKHIAHMHVMASNSEYVQDEPANRAVGVKNSDTQVKKWTRKR